MGYSTVVAGTSITASWANANVRDQVVTPFASTSARSSALSSPVEGMVSVITNNDRLEVYDGSAYQRIANYAAAGRTGGSWTRATNLSVSNGTETTITFTTEASDSDGFLTPTSGSVTIPSGLGGIYAFDIAYTWATFPTGTVGANGVRVGSTTRIAHNGLGSYSGSTRTGYSGILALSAADVVTFFVVQNSGGSINITEAALNFYRLAI